MEKVRIKVLVWDDGFLGNKEDNNIIRELHSVTPNYFAVIMKDGRIWQYNNAVSIESMYCPECKKPIEEDYIGRENTNVTGDYVCACKHCNKQYYLDDVLGNDEVSMGMI